MDSPWKPSRRDLLWAAWRRGGAAYPSPRSVGVDDWANCKGRHYLARKVGSTGRPGPRVGPLKTPAAACRPEGMPW